MSESVASYISWQEFDNHSQNQCGPEDVQNLQHEHQAVEEVEAEEGGVEGQGVHPCRMCDPGQRQNRESSQSHLQSHSKAH